LNLNLKFSIENDKSNITFKNDNINIYVKDCAEEQIKIYIKDDYYYCVNPICSDDCPISSGKAECIKSDIENINDIKLNKCQCLPGWIGDGCQLKDYAVTKYIIYIYIVVILI